MERCPCPTDFYPFEPPFSPESKFVSLDEPSFDRKLQLAKENGQDAIAHLLEIYRPWLIRLAEKQIASDLRPRLAASDVVQGSLLLALKNFPQFDGRSEGELRNWLKRIFEHHLIDCIRALFAQKRNQNGTMPCDIAREYDDLTPSKIVSAQEDMVRLVEGIAALDAERRAVVQLRYLQNLSFENIGQILNLTRHTAQRRWFEAIALLAHQLSPQS